MPGISALNPAVLATVVVRLERSSATQVRLRSFYPTPHADDHGSGSGSGSAWNYRTIVGQCRFESIHAVADGPTRFRGFALAGRGNHWILQSVAVRSNASSPAPMMRTLTTLAAPAAGGAASGGGAYEDGTHVPILATPAEGWAFQGWSGTGIADTHASATTVRVDADKTVTAHFVALSAPPSIIVVR